MGIISKLLRKNTSPARIAGFALSNFIGLLIVAGVVMFYIDSRGLWGDKDNFINTDFILVNKKLTSANTFGGSESTRFSADEISDLQ